MADNKDKRRFCNQMRDTNRAFIKQDMDKNNALHIGFVLQDHFSMLSFTAAVDALVTANLVHHTAQFSYETLAVDSSPVISDLGIEIAADKNIRSVLNTLKTLPDILIICGGFRCSTELHPTLNRLLTEASKQSCIIGGLWNGAIAMAHAGLLDHQSCALHPDNHAFIKERFPHIKVSDQVVVHQSNQITCAGPASALEMMLSLISETQGSAVVRAIREILSCDLISERNDTRLNTIGDNPCFPEKLREIMALMAANIEEPISVDDLSECMDLSRRQIERLFQHYLETSPARYYLELRITQARRLLIQTNESVTNIALACGFVSVSHFSNCFRDYFSASPSSVRDSARQQTSA